MVQAESAAVAEVECTLVAAAKLLTLMAILAAQLAPSNVQRTAQRQAERGINNEGAHPDANINRNLNRDLNRDVNRDTRDLNRDARVDARDRNARLGASNFDRNGIGRLDVNRYADRRDNNWRYAQWHNRWWYWQPGGYWVWWNGDRWNRYSADNYYDDYITQPTAVASSNANGPYYEDSRGFFYYENNQKVYDPNIQRVNTNASLPGPETR